MPRTRYLVTLHVRTWITIKLNEVECFHFLPSPSVDGDFTKGCSLGIGHPQQRIGILHMLVMVPRGPTVLEHTVYLLLGGG